MSASRGSQRELNRLRRELLRRGWTEHWGKHCQFRCPCGEHILVAAGSPSDHRALLNFRSMLSKTCWKDKDV